MHKLIEDWRGKMKFRASAIALVGALIWSTAFAAPAPDPFGVEAAKSIRHQGRKPFAVLVANPFLSDGATLDSFYATPTSAGAWSWSVRRVTINKLTRATTIRWADSRQCQALKGWVEGLARLRGPRVAVPGSEASAAFGPGTDGIGYDLWAQSNSDYASGDQSIGGGEMTLAAGSGTALDAWWISGKLEGCWNGQEPV